MGTETEGGDTPASLGVGPSRYTVGREPPSFPVHRCATTPPIVSHLNAVDVFACYEVDMIVLLGFVRVYDKHSHLLGNRNSRVVLGSSSNIADPPSIGVLLSIAGLLSIVAGPLSIAGGTLNSASVKGTGSSSSNISGPLSNLGVLGSSSSSGCALLLLLRN